MNSGLAGLGKAMDPLKEQLHMEIAQKLTATDALMKENLSKIVQSRVSETLIILYLE